MKRERERESLVRGGRWRAVVCAVLSLREFWFCVNLGGKYLLQAFSFYLTINTLINTKKVVDVRIFLYLCMCEKEQNNAHLQGTKVQGNLDSRK